MSNAPLRATGGAQVGPRSTFDVVAGVRTSPAAASAKPAAATAPAPDDLQRSAAWDAAAQNAPLLLAAAAAALACGLLTSTVGPWVVAWAIGGIALAAGWVAAIILQARRVIPRAVGRCACGATGLLLMLWMAEVVWLPAPQPSAAELALLRQFAVVAVACGGAFVFASLKELAAVPVLLPWLQLFAALPPSSQTLVQVPDSLLVALLSSLLAAALAIAARHAWQRRLRSQSECERRLAQVESACQAACRADEEKTRFLSATSHDLRQPVHALGLFGATLEKRLRGSPDEPLVSNIVRSIEGLDRSLNAMLDVSRLDAGVVEPNFQHFPLRDVFRRLHMQFAGQAELAGLSLRFAPGGKWVTSDPHLLERILGNLIQNAMKYTVRGGVVVVARSTATHFNVEVWDTGVGIAATELPRVFDEYYQIRGHESLRQQGLGMGLSIVKRLVRLLGHRLTVVSQPGRGTMFRLAIEKRGAPEVQDLTAPADTLPLPAGRVRTVLIVEDDDAVREGLALLLEESGYAALPASGLEEARQMLRVLELPPDLLLTDLRLGPGRGGLEVIEETRRECGFDLPVIVITGDTATDDLRQLGDGAHPVLFKPVDPHKLLLRIRSLVA